MLLRWNQKGIESQITKQGKSCARNTTNDTKLQKKLTTILILNK